MKASEYRKSLLEEDKKKPYRFVVIWYDDPEDPDDPEKTANEMIVEGKKIGCEGFKVDIDGAYSSLDIKTNKRYIYDIDGKKFMVDEDTLVYVRAPVTKRKSWSNLLTQLERENICCVNSRFCMESTSDKYRTSLVLAENELNQPQNVLIHNQNKALDAFDRIETDFPVILKTLTGSLGVGVVKIETEESLNATTQLMHKLDPNMGVLIQEYIPAKYDVRVHVIAGKIHGAIKRPIVARDFRSNVSLGSVPVSHSLTELESEVVVKAARAVDGLWVGVDFIPAKNREKDSPFFIEINSTPGTKGYTKATKRNLIGDVMAAFLNRDNWLRQKPFDSIFAEKKY